MQFDVNAPIVSVFLIPLLFIAFEFIYSHVFIHSEIRQHVNNGKPKKYIVETQNSIPVSTTPVSTTPVSTTRITSKSQAMSFDNLIIYIDHVKQKGDKVTNIYELSPGIERFNFGLQMILAAISVHANTLIVLVLRGDRVNSLSVLAVNNNWVSSYIALGLIILLLQFILSALVVVIRNVFHPEIDRRVRIFAHVVGANFAGLATLFILFAYLSGVNLP